MSWIPTSEQRAIITHDSARNGRVLAGPGTGKSATVIRMMLEMVDSGTGRGKLLTFTRAATNELKEKVAEHPEALESPSTIHSFAVSTILANPEASGLPEPLRIADDWEWERLIRFHLRDLVGCDVRSIKRARAEMASNWESLEPTIDPDLPVEVRNRFSGIWERHRLVFGYSLLAELPFRLLQALEDHPDLRLGDWEVMVVDEYQDLNLCDISVLKQISERGRCLVAVGDDDQSIYSFRRAHPVGIQRFVEDDYPGAVDYTLSISHRCGSKILEWARHVIEGLPGRSLRPPLTPASHCLPGEARYLSFRSGVAEARGAARLVDWLMRSKGIAPEDIAVLFRTNHNNAWSTPLQQEFQKLEIPVINPDEVSQMLGEPSNRRLLAIARLLVDRTDSLAWWALLELTNGIGPTVRDHVYDRAMSVPTTFAAQLLSEYADEFPDLPPASRNRVLSAIRPVLELIGTVDISGADLGESGWGTWLAERAVDFGGCEDRFHDLLVDLDEEVDRSEGLGRFLGQIQPVGKDLRNGRAAQAVRLMTMASSKGLTVRAAIVVGVEQGIIPYPDCHPDEERRLLYVAMTRSTDFLYLTWAGTRTGPTARTGTERVATGRNRSPLLAHSPVSPESADDYLALIGA
ncbi:MAG: ATP-dependent helicase [bacterium]|nr:ATP-dependent helicase [bacterium]